MKKPLMCLAAILLATGLAAQDTGGDKANKTGKTAVTPDAHADPRGGPDASKTTGKAHKGGKKGHKGGKKGKVSTEAKPGGPGVPPPTRPVDPK